MKFFATALLFAATALALPGGHHPRPRYDPCPSGLFSIPSCCDADALGILGLGCSAPPNRPSNVREFADCCRANSKRPRCCAITALDSGILCLEVKGL